MIKRNIPHVFTSLNLLSGLVAILMVMSDRLIEATFFVFLGIFFDFFDGFFARLYKVEGEFGKELDSLADMVTSGIVPGLIMYQLLLYATQEKWFNQLSCDIGNWESFKETNLFFLPFIGLIIPLASAFRLANFNIDERQSDSFIGLPTPAFALFVVSLPLILNYSDNQFFIDLIHNNYVLVGITLLGSYLLNSDMPLFSLKFKNYSWGDNKMKYLFLISSLVLLIIFKTVAIPLVIILYVLISLIENTTQKNKVT